MAGNTQWSTFHGDPQRTGYIAGSAINSSNVGTIKPIQSMQLGGPILSIPAIVDGTVYVGTANSVAKEGQPAQDGGHFYKIDAETGEIAARYTWAIDPGEGDTHGFYGMGCTPAIVGDSVYFSAFNGKLYCLNKDTLKENWVVNLRHRDMDHNQPVDNDNGQAPKAEGWCSPLVINDRVYVGIGEGENPGLFAFIFCLDAGTGQVQWIYCLNQFEEGKPNAVNQLPAQTVLTKEKPMTAPQKPYSVYRGTPITLGCSVWSAISYDPDLNRIYAATGNPVPDIGLPAKGYSYGILSLDAATGDYRGFHQMPPESSYRQSDIDVDFGASPVLYTNGDGVKVVVAACKNGSVIMCNADSMEMIRYRQMLPAYSNDGSDPNSLVHMDSDGTRGLQIPSVDPHSRYDTGSDPNPEISNAESNTTWAENFHGTYSTPAVDTTTGRIFVGVGGNNYHFVAPGIDYKTTPFMRAMDYTSFKDVWPLSDENPPRYINSQPPMYTTPAESGVSCPAIVNDVVFFSTTKIAVYAFNAADGKMLWHDDIGSPTGGFNGGYGYCLGPAVEGNYMVVGSLIYGSDGGVLRIYKLNEGDA